MKNDYDHFADWEARVFGYGYGTGEEFTISVLRAFFSLIGMNTKPAGSNDSYNYVVLQEQLGPQVAWLLINILCHADVIEYGTSPRCGWLTQHGERLRTFMLTHTADELIAMTERDQEYAHCFPDYCNCDDGPCVNPFWKPHTK